MKKLLILCAVIAFAVVPSFAQLSIEAELGLGYILENTSDMKDLGMKINKTSFPILVGAGYTLGNDINIPGLGETSLTVGGKLGYRNGTKATLDLDPGTLTAKWNTIPIYAFGRANSGSLFTELGLGIHKWTMETSANTGNAMMDSMLSFADEGIDVTMYIRGGKMFQISDKMNLTAGADLTVLSFDGEDSDSSIVTVGLFLGINFGL